MGDYRPLSCRAKSKDLVGVHGSKLCHGGLDLQIEEVEIAVRAVMHCDGGDR